MKYINRANIAFLTLIACGLIFVSCDTTNTSQGTTGQFAVKVTDAPANYDSVFIDIKAVKVKANGTDENGGDNGWITLNKEPRRLNLLKLQNGESILLGKKQVDAGFYHQIRFVLGDNNTVVVNGNTYPLKTPSAQESGLKLNIDARVEPNETYVLLIDFDASKSIVTTGSGKYILHPVLRAVELGETGSIKGTVEPNSFQTNVLVIADGDTLRTLTGNNGEFKFIGVLKNSYKVSFMPESKAYSDTTITDVSVDANEDVDLGTIALPDE